MCWWLWDFIVIQVEFNKFFQPNDPHERIICDLVIQLRQEPSKTGHIIACFFWKSMKLVKLSIKLLNQDSSTKIIFRKIKLIFGLGNLLWKLKKSTFWQVCLKLSYKIWKNPLRGLIGMQKTMETHLPHYEISQP